MPWQRLILRLPQLVFVQPIEVKLGNKHILPQLAPSGDIRMNLPELGHSCAIHPGRSARAMMDGATVAQFAQIHPDVAAERKLRQDVFIAELYLDRLYKHELRQPQYEPLPRHPAVERDFSFIFADSVVFEKIQAAVHGLNLGELRSFVPVELFRGG